MNSAPKISVIMPVYNTQEEYLRPAIESILHQTFKDFELIIIDDCSTNNALGIAQSYQDPRIKIITCPQNGGAAQARNIGLEQSRGKYIAMMDSDDISLPKRLEKQFDYLEKHPQIGVLSATIQKFPLKAIIKRPRTHSHIIHQCAFLENAINNPVTMLRKEIYQNNKSIFNIPIRNCEDYAIWLALIGKTQFANLSEVLFLYRWSGQNISITQEQKQQKTTAELLANKWLEIAQLEDIKTKEILVKFILRQELCLSELNELENFFVLLLKKLTHHPIYDFSKSFYYLQKHIRKIIRKAPNNYAQQLCSGRLAKIFKLSFLFKLKIRLKNK